MLIIVKCILILSFLLVFFQDVKERLVYWFLFPIIAICSGILMYHNIIQQTLLITLSINIGFVLFLLVVVGLYSKIRLKTSIKETFGLGDGFLFLALTFTFSNVTFIVLFVFGMIFSLLLHLALKQKSKIDTVPLAGYLSLFFAIAYGAYWTGFLESVYIF